MNLYKTGIDILSEHITIRKIQGMFNNINNILSEGDTVKIVVTKHKDTLSVTMLTVLKEDQEGKLPPISASGLAAELDDQLWAAYKDAINKVRELVIDAKTIVDEAKALKKKAEDEKKSAGKGKTSPAPVVKGSPKVAAKPETDGQDGEEDPENEEPESDNKQESTPKVATKPDAPKLTPAQKKATEDVKALVARLESTKDSDMATYLKNQAVRILKGAELPTEETEAKFDARITELETATA